MEQHNLTPAQMQQFLSVVNEVERYRDLSEEEKENLIIGIIDRPYMDLRSDWAFKHILQNADILKMLLNDFLPEDIESVEQLPNEIDRLQPDEKNVIMDVLCRTTDGRRFIVEMQRKKKKSFKNRMLYYGASMLHSQLKPRQSYSELQPVYVICFMDYRMKHETDQLVYRYSMREQESGELYNSLLSIYLCELTRLKETSIEGLDPIRSWFFILKNMRTFAGKPEDMGERYAAIAKAALMYGLPDEDKIKYFRNMITEEEKMELYETGFEDGMEKGMEKGVRETARRLKNLGVPAETIVRATGLSLDEVSLL
jgi:predicted transposase/invertase (TIGR01784 family)